MVALAQTADYEVQIATDSGFSNIVYSQSSAITSHQLTSALNTLTTYYWRVRATNLCGRSSYSGTWSFTTLDVPPILLVDDDDNSPDVFGTYKDVLDALGQLVELLNAHRLLLDGIGEKTHLSGLLQQFCKTLDEAIAPAASCVMLYQPAERLLDIGAAPGLGAELRTARLERVRGRRHRGGVGRRVGGAQLVEQVHRRAQVRLDQPADQPLLPALSLECRDLVQGAGSQRRLPLCFHFVVPQQVVDLGPLRRSGGNMGADEGQELPGADPVTGNGRLQNIEAFFIPGLPAQCGSQDLVGIGPTHRSSIPLVDSPHELLEGLPKMVTFFVIYVLIPILQLANHHGHQLPFTRSLR